MKLLTFLGTGRYDETEYVWNEQMQVTRYAPVASAVFANINQAVILATTEAQHTHEAPLREALPLPTDAIHFVTVPKGENQVELWEIFSKVSENVNAGEDLVFDVTHGLRSFPLIGLLAAAFLRVGFDVKLRHVFYGAFDVRDQTKQPNRTPMFDLTPMLALLEWAAAADRFNRTGDGRYFASLLRYQQKELARQANEVPEKLYQVGNIGRLADNLTEISQSLALIRPHHAMEKIEKLPSLAEQALPVLTETHSSRPFRLILDSTLDAYKDMGLKYPEQEISLNLATQRKIIEWYASHEHWVQAVSLAREWLVSWIMFKLGLTKLTEMSDRQRIEGVVNSEAESFLRAKQAEQSYQTVFLKAIPQPEEVLGLWKSLAGTRNDIDHAAMRSNPQDAESLIGQIKSHIEKINSLPI